MKSNTAVIALAATVVSLASLAHAQCPANVPAIGAPPPAPLPVFPADNWWNTDVSAAPVDPNSASYIAFVNNGGTRRLHPDFGGEVSTGSVATYGMPYAVVDGNQPKLPVTFGYWGESDGVDASGNGLPFYPIPAQAISQPHWVEGGSPGNVDERTQADRHLIIVDCTNRTLYELYNVFYDSTRGRWLAGSGAFFDMKSNWRRPDGWTSADAAGLAIFPGLVRYDDAWNPAITDIGHAFRVTVRATNGYVYPASHRAGSTAGALPMGARLRLRTNVNGTDPALRTTDPNVQKIFRAMQKYGLVVADNGSDMYVTGTFDTRWNNGILNPAFALLSASDFDVVQLGWKPAPPPSQPPKPPRDGIAITPSIVVGGTGATGTVSLDAPAPTGGAVVSLSSASTAVVVPSSVTVSAGATGATFPIVTGAVTQPTLVTLSATYAGVTTTTTFTVNPPAFTVALSGLVLARTTEPSGGSVAAKVTLSAPAPAGGTVVLLASSMPGVIRLPSSVTVRAGQTSSAFKVDTTYTPHNVTATLSATYAGTTKTATLTATAK
jgi:hypothetical protein